jgi:predicted Zn-dependent protease
MQHLLHWKQMPVRIYFIPSDAAARPRREEAQDGFEEWVKATGGLISYRIVDTQAQADITVAIDAGSTVPGQHGASGNTSVLYSRDEMKHAGIEIAAGGTTPNELQEIAAHEFGHALGIDGHSDNPDDLMTPVEVRICDSLGSPIDAPAHPVTSRDLNTLKLCYSALFAASAPPKTASLASTIDDPDSETIAPASGSY